ncbi:cytochrome b/b6 domain-containing protein [Calderihabitans maritimus]|uniref:Ni/Fe-hydrogenase, b-type cytochrome subunit n=1 Tax=Calderihabitans maritimus TaxID=1246530 RepID=A0A1Z5HNQ0_9FIRM|nr:cytochrome b/b6 domain-containing protein [Calderihabitans maritimus]GAW90925.1 Ni/Fe-hydrogenase, b-type cytochrome subunit [Calderihabitans maritimus]
MARPTDYPFPQRVMHYLHLIGIITLVFTGFLIHHPPQGTSQSALRVVHVLVGIIVLVVVLVRIYYAFNGFYRDAHQFALRRDDWRNLPAVIRHYLTLKGELPPHSGKYNPLQKLSYLGVVVLVLAQSLTGMALYWPGTFSGLVASLEGLAGVRASHYALTWLLITFIMVHLYMVISETPDRLRLMLLGQTGGVGSEKEGAGTGSRQYPLS